MLWLIKWAYRFCLVCATALLAPALAVSLLLLSGPMTILAVCLLILVPQRLLRGPISRATV